MAGLVGREPGTIAALPNLEQHSPHVAGEYLQPLRHCYLRKMLLL
jgi:hypothetical protein